MLTLFQVGIILYRLVYIVHFEGTQNFEFFREYYRWFGFKVNF